MNRLFIFPQRFVNAVVVFGVIAIILSFIPFFSEVRASMSGWALLLAVFFFLVFSTLKGFFMDMGDWIVGGTRFEPTPAIASVLDVVSDWVIYALTLFATAAILPGLASYSAALPILVMAVLGGTGAACWDAKYVRVTSKR
jgi:hypothetical protein